MQIFKYLIIRGEIEVFSDVIWNNRQIDSMRQDELICPSCAKEYTQSNPPRLLTMCGHTFCHTCIKVMIVKKKDGKFKLKCPSDKISIDLQASKPEYFPKNMILLDVISKRRRHSRLSFHGGGLKFAKKPAQDDQAFNEFLPTDRTQADQANKENGDSPQQNICRLHSNPLDIICLVDKAKICFECALFGIHKGHKFSSIKEEGGQKSSFYKQILAIIEQKQAIEMRLSNEEIKDQILGLFKNKKEETIGIVRYHYRKLQDQIKRAQKQLIAEIMNYFCQTEGELSKLTTLNEDAKLIFKIWEDNAFRQLKKMEQKGRRVTVQGDIQDKQKYIIANGYDIIAKMKNQEHLLIQNVEDIVQSLTIHTRPEVVDQIQHYCSIRIQKIQSRKTEETQSLLDNEHDCSLLLEQQSKRQIPLEKTEEIAFLQQQSKFIQRQRQQAQKQEEYHQELLTEEAEIPLSFIIQTQPLQYKKPQSKQRPVLNASMIARTQTPTHKAPVMKARSNSLASLNSNSSDQGFKSKMAQKASLKSKAQQKYESAISGIENGTVEIIDLYNSEIGNDLLKDLFKKVKISSNCKVRSLRMVKNNLNDDSAQLAIETLDKVNFLSLAQNNYSDKFIKQLVQFAKNKNYTNAKTVLLGQNRLTERKVKESFEELKKHNISVIL